MPHDLAHSGSEDQIAAEADDVGRGDLLEVLSAEDRAGGVIDLEDDGIGGDVEAIARVLSPGETVVRRHARRDAPDVVVGVVGGDRPDLRSVGAIHAGDVVVGVRGVDIAGEHVEAMDRRGDRGLPADSVPHLAGGGRADHEAGIQFGPPFGQLGIPLGILSRHRGGRAEGDEHGDGEKGRQREGTAVESRCGHVSELRVGPAAIRRASRAVYRRVPRVARSLRDTLRACSPDWSKPWETSSPSRRPRPGVVWSWTRAIGDIGPPSGPRSPFRAAV